ENRWMDAPGIVRWLNEGAKPFIKPRLEVRARSALLVLDSYSSHLTDKVKAKFKELNIVPAVVPGGGTAEVQPRNVLNQPLIQCERAPAVLELLPHEVTLKWISRATKAVLANLIKRAFLTCGISNVLDVSDVKLAMAHRRSELAAEVDVDDEVTAGGF
ncbi:unnamed protein product, partial [Closterium sp. NIES-53]